MDLIKRLAVMDGQSETEDLEAWYRAKYSEEPGYSTILARLSKTSPERRAILQPLHLAVNPGMCRGQLGGRGKIVVIGKFGAQRGLIKQVLNILGLLQPILGRAVEPAMLRFPVVGCLGGSLRKGKRVAVARSE